MSFAAPGIHSSLRFRWLLLLLILPPQRARAFLLCSLVSPPPRRRQHADVPHCPPTRSDALTGVPPFISECSGLTKCCSTPHFSTSDPCRCRRRSHVGLPLPIRPVRSRYTTHCRRSGCPYCCIEAPDAVLGGRAGRSGVHATCCVRHASTWGATGGGFPLGGAAQWRCHPDDGVPAAGRRARRCI